MGAAEGSLLEEAVVDTLAEGTAGIPADRKNFWF